MSLTEQSAHQQHNYHHEYQNDDSISDSQLSKTEQLYECTENQQKIWRLFNSLDCPDCALMYNNKQRKPQIICANNHLLCKSCYCTSLQKQAKTRQSSLLCPFCNVRISHKSSSSSHQSIQMFLKIYNQIYEQQRNIIEEKRKRAPSSLDFQMPKNLKTLLFLLLIIVTPWIYDGLKYIVCWLIEWQCRVVQFFYAQVSQVIQMVSVVIQDQFYIGLYTNEKGQYMYYGQEMWQCGTATQEAGIKQEGLDCEGYWKYSALLTEKHRLKLATYTKIIYVVGCIFRKLSLILSTLYFILRAFMYTLHFIILGVGLVQFPFLIPLILIKIQVFVPKRYIYRIGLYLDILEPDYEDIDAIMQMEEDVQKLTKFQLYFFLCVGSYMRYVLTIYRSVEQDMKKRCEELQYKRKMRQIKKTQKQKQKSHKTLDTNTKTKIKFSFN